MVYHLLKCRYSIKVYLASENKLIIALHFCVSVYSAIKNSASFTVYFVSLQLFRYYKILKDSTKKSPIDSVVKLELYDIIIKFFFSVSKYFESSTNKINEIRKCT